jgi:hypothetical protein
MFCCTQLRGVHVGVPHTLGIPPPPHVWGDVHVPQSSPPPQPSPAGPQLMCWAAQLVLLHVGTSGVTHDPRSKIMYSRSFSCGVIGPATHSLGKVRP